MTGELRVLRCGRLFDSLFGAVLADRSIVIRGERIDAVLGPDDAQPDPSTVTTTDLTGHTVLPGLIDCHTHLVGDLEYADVPAVGVSAGRELLLGAAHARATLRAGFTSVRDVGTFRAFLDLELRDAIEDGLIQGPRMQGAGAYVTKPGGGGEVSGEPGYEAPAEMRVGVVRTPEDVRRVVRLLCERGADVIKVIATGAVLTRGTEPGTVELDEAMLRAAVDEAARHGRFVAAHAHGTEGIRLAVRAGVRSIEHGSLIDDEGIALMAELGTYLVADIYDGDWIEEQGVRAGWPAETMRKNRETTQAQRVGFRRAVEAGVKIAFGTDSGVYPHGRNAVQLGYMVRCGMTPEGAAKAATATAAELMGWPDRVGSATPGHFADLVAVPGDPFSARDGSGLDTLLEPAFVMKGGVVVRDERDITRAM